MPVLHFLIPNMLGYGGHIFNQTLEIGRAAEKRGWSFRSYLPREVEDDAIVQGLQGVRALTNAATMDFADPGIDLGAANLRFHLDLAALGRENFAADDFIFLSALHHRNAEGFVKWLSGFPEAAMPGFTAHLWSHECYFNFTDEIHRRNSAIFGRALRWIAAHRAKCRKLLGFSPVHQALLAELAGDDTLVEPYTAAMPETPPASATRDPAVTRFGNFGLFGWDQKGLRPWLGAIRRLLAAPDYRFSLHLDLTDANFDAPALLAEYADVIGHPSVDAIHGGMTRERYHQVMAACDIVVLPYGPAYDTRESAILHEAATYGAGVVLPETSLPAWRLKQAGIDMPRFAAWTPDAIAAACRQAADRKDRLHQAMRAGAARLNKGFSVDRILDLVGLTARSS